MNNKQKHLLQLLKEIDSFCKEHNITYYCAAGTVLGAIRHGGFIPWDDDIDIKMPRPDYEKLLVMQPEFPGHIVLDAPRAEHCEYTFLKLIDSRTVLEEQNGDRIKRTGVYLDVLPMDGHPADPETTTKHLAELSRLNSLFHASLSGFSSLRSSSSVGTRAKGLLYSKLYSPWKLYRQLTETAKKFPYDEAEQVGLLVEGDPIRERFEKSWLEPPTMMLFERQHFPAPNAAEEHLSIFYRKPISRELYYQKLPRIDSDHHHRVYWKE